MYISKKSDQCKILNELIVRVKEVNEDKALKTNSYDDDLYQKH